MMPSLTPKKYESVGINNRDPPIPADAEIKKDRNINIYNSNSVAI